MSVAGHTQVVQVRKSHRAKQYMSRALHKLGTQELYRAQLMNHRPTRQLALCAGGSQALQRAARNAAFGRNGSETTLIVSAHFLQLEAAELCLEEICSHGDCMFDRLLSRGICRDKGSAPSCRVVQHR